MLFGIHGAYQKTELAAIISLVRSEPLSDSSSIVSNGQNVSTFCHRVCTERLTCLRLRKGFGERSYKAGHYDDKTTGSGAVNCRRARQW
jgi:hypothetical protein